MDARQGSGDTSPRFEQASSCIVRMYLASASASSCIVKVYLAGIIVHHQDVLGRHQRGSSRNSRGLYFAPGRLRDGCRFDVTHSTWESAAMADAIDACTRAIMSAAGELEMPSSRKVSLSSRCSCVVRVHASHWSTQKNIIIKNQTC